ncbi:MAG: EAL domain-containing protein [Rhizobium sp.]|nr:EAL domain-containing protein [Rhizobium sp.]
MARKFSFGDLPIGRKLLLVCLLVTGSMLFALSTLAIVKQVTDWRKQSLSQLTSSAGIISANTAPALLFDDRKAATDTLAALSEVPDVVFAAVYDKEGKMFAVYGARTGGPDRLATQPQQTDYRFSRAALIFSQPIRFKGERLGTIYLKSDLQRLVADLLMAGGLTLGIAAIAFGLATLLFLRLQRGIVQPIIDLSETMISVTRDGNYAIRAQPGNQDEVGALAHSFNGMLEVIQDRDKRLANQQVQLEETVRERTAELNQSNLRLAEELTQRKAAQEDLIAHDAMLKAVTHGAAELLGSINLDEAIAAVLELIGRTLAVSRVQLGPITSGRNGHLLSAVRHEWCAPGLPPMIDDAMFQALDLNVALPLITAATLVGERSMVTLDNVTTPARQLFEQAGMQSMLIVPVMIDGKLWGALWFIDSNATPRTWNWAETDTLSTLAGLIGISTMRSRYLAELADANTIVQNSPTVLYRLKGEPALPLTYISSNVNKFGYSAKTLLSGDTSFHHLLDTLIHPDDRPRWIEAMANVMDKKAGAGSIEVRLLLPTGSYRWLDNRYSPVRDEVDRLVEIEGIFTDITERKAAEEKITLLARTDSLTGLANRATFVERMRQTFIAAGRSRQAFAILYLDLDHFKDINDTRGHPVGDMLLREAAERLKNRVRDTDLVARLGGDEFAVLQADIGEPSTAGTLATEIIDVLGAPYIIGGAELRVTASVGISVYSDKSVGPDELLAEADLALYRAKEEGRNQYRFHSDELDKEVNERVVIAADLRKALANEELFLHYQPQIELADGKIIGMEALVRWRHPTRGVLMPGKFIPVAEGTGVIQDLGRWVLGKALTQMKLWQEAGVAPPVIAINVSLLQLKNGAEFIKDVTALLVQTGVKASELELDVTESMLAQVTLARNPVLERLTEMGVKIALDDFGGEYSSFDYLRAYRVSHLKVARDFIERAGQDDHKAKTVRAIIGAAREMGIQVIAEGVETSEQRAMLLSFSPKARGQGFYFSEAVDVDSATALLRTGSIEPSPAPARRAASRRKSVAPPAKKL